MTTLQEVEKKNTSYWLQKLHLQQEKNSVKSPESIGHMDAEQSMSKQKTIVKVTVDTLLKKSNRILMSISSHHIPFDFFPNTINVEESRVTIINRNFFSSSQIHSVDIKDISNIFINASFFFAQLIIISRTFSDNNIKLDFLKKDEAIHMRRIIEGLRIFETNKVDTSNYTQAELLSTLEKLSTTNIVM